MTKITVSLGALVVAASLGMSSAAIAVTPTAVEKAELSMLSPAKQKEVLARATGGRYATWDEREALLAAMPCQPRERQVNLEEPLWPKTPWLLLALACLCTEWWWRRKLRLT